MQMAHIWQLMHKGHVWAIYIALVWPINKLPLYWQLMQIVHCPCMGKNMHVPYKPDVYGRYEAHESIGRALGLCPNTIGSSMAHVNVPHVWGMYCRNRARINFPQAPSWPSCGMATIDLILACFGSIISCL